LGGTAVTPQPNSTEEQVSVDATSPLVKEVEVTRLVGATQLVEVTRIVEATQLVEVTRIVEVTKLVEAIVTATPQIPVVQFKGPSMFLVGKDIEAGTYKIEGECYWERLSCLDGSFNCITANANISGQSYVTITADDKAFNTTGNCTFIKTE
jgi:hypothetical protein